MYKLLILLVFSGDYQRGNCATLGQSDGLRFDRNLIPVDSLNMSKKIALLLLCVAVGIASYIALDFWALQNGHPESRLERLWAEDVADLAEAKKLPPFWNDIQKVEMYGGDTQAKDWARKIEVPIKTNPQGTHKLEVLLLTWEENGKRGAVIQYDAVDLKSQNMVWELGRTFILQ